MTGVVALHQRDFGWVRKGRKKMQKKVLIAVDQSNHAREAIKYAARMGALIKDIGFVLFHVQPMISQYIVEEARTKPKARSQLEALRKKNHQAALDLLENCKTRLTEMGVAAECIELRTGPRDAGVADDIIYAAEAGKYDAVLIGRRGLSAFQELFVGSVTTNLVVHAKQIPVWLVDGTVSCDNVLIAVDGSVNSLRALDHMVFMLSESPKPKIELLHIKPKLGDYCEIDMGDMEADTLSQAMENANQRCLTDFRAQALKMLKDAGFTDSQINFRQVEKRLSPAKAITEELQKGDFGTLVIGKHGMSKSQFMGRVAGTVVQKIQDRAVWIVP